MNNQNNQYRGKSSQNKQNNRQDRFSKNKNATFGRDKRTINSAENTNTTRENKNYKENTYTDKPFKNKKHADKKYNDKKYSDKKYNTENKYDKQNKPYNKENGYNKNRDNKDKKPYTTSKEERYENLRIKEPQLPEEIEANELDSKARTQLKGLRKEVAEKVAKHLVMAGKIIDIDPQTAYEHANYALKCASRVPIVREAVALCAYQCENYAQALRELKAYERLTGKKTLPSIEIDSLRATGKIEQAIQILTTLEMKTLDLAEQVEVVIVSASIRHDMGQTQLGIDILDNTLLTKTIGKTCEKLGTKQTPNSF